MFPLDVVLFPGELFGLHVFEERYLLMMEEVLEKDLPIGIVLARQDQPETRVEYEPEAVGTAARILRHERIGDRYLVQTVGTRRFRIEQVFSEKPYQEAVVTWLDETEGDAESARELAQEVFDQVLAMGGTVEWGGDAVEDPVFLSHAVGAALQLDLQSKQALLASPDAEERLRMEALILQQVA